MSTLDLEHVASLARLTINDDHKDKVTEKTKDLMALIDQMQAVDTDGIEPMAHPLSIQQPTRADEALPCDREALQACAPDKATSHYLYLVPQVIE